MTTKIITYCFYILFFLTPLFFTKYNSELFEYNKMMLVYLLTTIIVGAWIVKCINLKSLILNRTPLDIPIVLFLLSQILSTIFSIDPHTSLWGYYSRSNGGLISIISYILLYYALVSNFDWEQAKKFLRAALFGGLAVSLYAIPEHFGVSPSCILLQGTFSADCWVQDVQSRVFATLGQPNWLAAYLEMLIFPAIYFALTAKERFGKYFYGLLVVLYYMAFTFTYSRGAMIGFIVSLLVFLLLLPFCHPEATSRRISGLVPVTLMYLKQVKRFFTTFRMTVIIIAIFILINLLFGSALTGDFRLFKQATVTSRPGISQTASVGTQLENGGTESGQIRLIVWKGALDIFKHYPIFGSGVETFAYSYYNFRPVEHNLVSEWDFLYNKAHNEYLNYLATTGIVGFLSYMLLIISFVIWCIRQVMSYELGVRSKKVKSELLTLNSALLASYIAYLVQNFFGFSVVIVALFFFLFPAFAFLASATAAGAIQPWQFSKHNIFYQIIQSTILRKKGFQTLSVWVVIITSGLILFSLGKYWWADKLYKDGQDFTELGNPGKAYNILFDAADINPNEPLYKAELGNAAAEAAVSLETDNATASGTLKNQAVDQTEKALKISPYNTSIWRTAIRTYYDLSIIDPSFEQKTLDVFDQTIKLAPTDPKLYYNKALVQEALTKTDDEIVSLKKAVELKPDYLDAVFKLGEAYQVKGDLKNAKSQFENILKFTPDDPGSLEKLQQIATASVELR